MSRQLNLYVTTTVFNWLDCLPLGLEFGELAPVDGSTDVGLEHRNDLAQSLITHLLEGTEHTGLGGVGIGLFLYLVFTLELLYHKSIKG